MDKFINKPSLPTSQVTLVAVSNQFPKIVQALNNLGVSTVTTSPYKYNTSNPEASHADMQILHLGDNKIALLNGNDEFNNQMQNEFSNYHIDIIYTSGEITKFKYPYCVKLNFALVGNNVIGCFKYGDENVLKALESYRKINVSQGYAKCSTAIVGENAIITSDESIAKAAKQNEIDCLKISAGNIYLCERYEGFIGGACCLIDKNTLAFTGDIRRHPDYIEIKAFCNNHGVSLLSLTDNMLCDVGGIVPLLQRGDNVDL